MAPTRVWLLAAVLACMLLVRPAAADAATGPGGFGCNPLTDKTCRLGPFENKPDGLFGAPKKVPGSDDCDDDDELPSFDTHRTILGH